MISRMTLQGTPAALTPAGLFFVTALPDPMVTPWLIWTPPPTHTQLELAFGTGKPSRRTLAGQPELSSG